MPYQFAFAPAVDDGDACTITAEGFNLTAKISRDDSADPPWAAEDGHGPVSDWRPMGSHGHAPKRPGERVLHEERGGSARFYDFAEAVKIARRDGWDCEPFGQGTPGERAVRAAESDFKRLKAWCEDDWFYVGVSVTVERAGVALVGEYEHALWSVESDCGDHIAEVAADLAAEAVEAARAKMAALCEGVCQ